MDHAAVAARGLSRFTEGDSKMSIQLAPNTSPARDAGRPVAARLAPATVPRVLQSARAPAQLSFFFKRG